MSPASSTVSHSEIYSLDKFKDDHSAIKTLFDEIQQNPQRFDSLLPVDDAIENIFKATRFIVKLSFCNEDDLWNKQVFESHNEAEKIKIMDLTEQLAIFRSHESSIKNQGKKLAANLRVYENRIELVAQLDEFLNQIQQRFPIADGKIGKFVHQLSEDVAAYSRALSHAKTVEQVNTIYAEFKQAINTHLEDDLAREVYAMKNPDSLLFNCIKL